MLSAFVKIVETRHLRWLETIHNGSLPRRFPEWSKARQKRYVELLSHAERVIAVSSELADFFVRIGVEQALVVEVGPLLPGIADASTRPIRESVERFIRRHDPILLTVGVMVPRYDLETIVAVFEEIRVSHPHAGLLIASGSADSSSEFARKLGARLNEQGDSVCLLEDVDHSELLAMMSRSDVMIRGSETESYGLCRVEAILAGTPVVATARGELRYVIPYRFADPRSLHAGIVSALSRSPAQLAGARLLFENLANDNLAQLISLYQLPETR